MFIDDGYRTPTSPKAVSRRKNRPAWAGNDRELMLRVVDKRLTRRWAIARMYWRENKTAAEIAKHFGTTINAIKSIIKQVKGS